MEVKKILIVEDDLELANMYSMKFEREGFQVHICSNWLNAVTDVTTYFPDVILLDIMMPGMDGFETLRVIRQLAPSLKTKIIMFTNLNSQSDIDRCMMLGADEFLLKANTTPKEAVERVRQLLEDSKKLWQTAKVIHPECPHCHHIFEMTIDLEK